MVLPQFHQVMILVSIDEYQTIFHHHVPMHQNVSVDFILAKKTSETFEIYPDI
jgi:hypothetical protein